MEKGSAGLLCTEKEGGSMRRKGELEARRLESRPMRLCLGEPRLWAMGVELVDKALRTDGTDGEAVRGSALFTGDATSENLDGLENPSEVFDFLVGELKKEGSTFSESSSSKMAGPRARLPVEAVGLGLRGEANLEFSSGVIAKHCAFSFWVSTVEVDCLPFCLFLELWRACSRGLPSSAKGWRVKKAIAKYSKGAKSVRRRNTGVATVKSNRTEYVGAGVG